MVENARLRPEHLDTLKDTLTYESLAKQLALENTKLPRIIAEALELCKPERAFV